MIQYKIIKQLGFGTKGKVYLIDVENKFYALKIEKLNKIYFWREINFYKNFAITYPSNFIQLIDYEIKDNIVKKICTMVDTTLDKIILTLNKFELLSIIIQITYSVYLLHINNYVHGDLRAPNIGVNRTIQTHISIESYQIPTYGWIVQLIDFGSIGEKNEAIKLNDLEWYENKFNTELTKLANIFIDKSKLKPIERYCKDKVCNSNIVTGMDLWIEKYLNTKDYYYKLIGKKVKNKYIPKLLIDKNDIIDYIRLSIKPLDLIDYFYKKYFCFN